MSETPEIKPVKFNDNRKKYNFKVEKFGIEKVVVEEGFILAEDIESAKSSVIVTQIRKTSEWSESKMFIENEINNKCVMIPCWIKSDIHQGKLHTLTLWEI